MVSKKVSRVSLPSLPLFLSRRSGLTFPPWVFLEVEATWNPFLPTWLSVNFLSRQHMMNQYMRWLQFLDLQIHRRRDAQRAGASEERRKTQHQRGAKNRVGSIGHSWRWLNSTCSRIWRRDWQVNQRCGKCKDHPSETSHTASAVLQQAGPWMLLALQIERQVTDYQVFDSYL